MMEVNRRKPKFASIPKSPIQEGRPRSMVTKNVHTVIPAHIVAEAMSNFHGLGLRWSGPVTPNEMRYVQQYVLAKYPEYSNSLIEGGDKTDLYNLCIKEESEPKSLQKSTKEGSTPFFNFVGMNKTKLEPSRLLDFLTKKSDVHGNFISIPEIQARNKVLKHCGLHDEDYLVVFTPSYKDAMVLVGESYPFFKENFYLSIIPRLCEWYTLLYALGIRSSSKFLACSCRCDNYGCWRGPVKSRSSHARFYFVQP